jgi:hypothetical protein
VRRANAGPFASFTGTGTTTCTVYLANVDISHSPLNTALVVTYSSEKMYAS